MLFGNRSDLRYTTYVLTRTFVHLENRQGGNTVRNFTISALALLASATSVAQTGDTWGDLMSHAQDPPSWPQALEGIHIGHIPPPSPNVDNPANHWGRLAIWGHGVIDDTQDLRSTQMYVWDTKPDPLRGKFINQSGNPTVAPIPNLLLSGVDCFCGGHTGDKNGNLLIVGGALDGH